MARVLERELVRHRSREERIARARQRWVTLFSSLWTPWVVFLGALVLYLIAIAITDDGWRVPRILFLALCGLISGWLLLGWTLALVPPMAQRRAARIRAAETLDDLHRAVQNRPFLQAEKLSMLAEVARRLESAWVDGDPALISREVERATRAMDQETPGWRRADFWAFAKSFGLAAVTVLVLRVALFEPYSIPSGSMLPSLRVGDYVLVNKFIYGIQIPFTNIVPFALVRKPRRGDVVVFKNPLDDSVNLVKRIVGEPGDTVELRSEILYINDVAQPREVADPVSLIEDKVGERWLGRQGTLYLEQLGGVSHFAFQYSSHPQGRTLQGPYVVPEDQFFVVGDNRDGSEDSRAGFGLSSRVEFVPTGHIKGKATLVFLSFGPGGLFSRVFGGVGLRLERLFVPVR